mmetsp:Transcript_21590/g.46973  ORF Transcript_21590/g.46973 Transcript_21590/m.46973 type:complete len:761 (-) Transcript_21590:168-2450(-)|eukprot:CAMPEP_0172320998 /NCGR_PEP_ID=MMETSP1058-20130122/41951_1 /TAXON_ID=83371 /ORGANISM="Detonula confervacea, Strain CCMP 353" /LENGTH=760 /DNA_ID=CAMNT_0013036371 /DNA_START=129 /DNA_END=2411 /DNA_ORIENTATION=+
MADPAISRIECDAKIPASSIDEKSTTSHVNNNVRTNPEGESQRKRISRKEAQPAKNKQIKEVVSPSMVTKPTSISLHMADPLTKSQLKPPPELLAMKGTSLPAMKSRWVPPAVENQPPSLSLPPQPNLAFADSWINALKKQATSASRQKVKSDERVSKPDLQKQKGHTEHASAKRNPVIFNLEESYFKRPMTSPNQSETSNPQSKINSVKERGNMRKIPSSASVKSDESDVTQHHSNKINSNAQFPRTAMEHQTLSNEGGDKSSSGKESMSKTIAESQKEDNTREKSEAEFEAELQRALIESAKQQSRHMGNRAYMPEVIVLDDSDDQEDTKLPAKVNGITDRKNESTTSASAEEAQMNEAIRLSLEEAEKSKRRFKYSESESIPQTCRTLSQHEFKEAIDAFVEKQGGYEEIESGNMIKHGNANDMKKNRVADGGGLNQTGAQYGRYSIERMWRIFDVLEGNADISIIEESDTTVNNSPRKLASVKGKEEKIKQVLESKSRLDGLSGAKVKAFVDIGHGIGIQVLQSGWALGIPARGVEIMKDRHLIADAIKEGVLESLRNDPPDGTMAELELADFSCAVIPDKETNNRDEKLRSFLLFEDKPNEVQKGLVIFINNAEEVFAARSNQTAAGICLDAHLAKLFANMQIGGRMVTLTDVSCHLTQSTEWFQHDVFQSGTNAVSWGRGNKSIDVHVLTKLSCEWFCQNNKCPYKILYRNVGTAPNAVVNESGELNEFCVFCSAPAKRCSRLRKPSKRRKEEE